jgi:hypothetical protein
MEILERNDFSILLSDRPGPLVSLFMPTYQMGREVQQNPIRLKNLLTQADQQLQDLGLRSPESRELLAPAWDLVEELEFWKYQKEGLAVFLSQDVFRYCRVPFNLEELVVVSQDRFHIKPVLPLLTEAGSYYVLALSQSRVRLLECTRYDARELDLAATSVPANIEEALHYDDPEQQLQFRSSQDTTPSPEGSRWASIFHGHGGSNQEKVKEDLRRYFLQIDNGVREVIGHGGAPLVLAGVDYLLPIYAEHNKYADLLEEGVTGNPDQLRAEELHQRSWPLVEPRFRSDQDRWAASYREMRSKGLASSDLGETIRAARLGRVGVLLVSSKEEPVWGVFNEETEQVQTRNEPQAGDQDLLDLAAFLTLTNSGAVFTLNPEAMPVDSPLAAIFRY